MGTLVTRESSRQFGAYAAIPSAFDVTSRVRLDRLREGIREEPVEPPWRKDYDAAPGEGPQTWADRWNTRRWGVFAARVNGERAGGAVVVPPGEELAPEAGAAVLWDLRVHPSRRRAGVGTALLRAAAAWAARRGCDRLVIETQDTNVPACRLYAREGCRLVSVRPNAYAACPGEAEMVWLLPLG